MGAPRMRNLPAKDKKRAVPAETTKVEDKRLVEALRQALDKKLKDPKEAKKAADLIADMLTQKR
jgi:hypothetical protein